MAASVPDAADARHSAVALRRRRLGAELRRTREARGLTLARVAERCGWHKSKLSRIERARTQLAPDDLDLLLAAYQVTTERRAELLSLAADHTAERPWWLDHLGAISPTYREFIALEAAACEEWEYQPLLVPGLLQTREYARAVNDSWPTHGRPTRAEALVGVRMRRQRLLTDTPPLRFTGILTEAALRMAVGGRTALGRQLDRLVELTELPSVTIRVIPFEAGAGGCGGGMTLFHFPGQHDPPVAFADAVTGGSVRESDQDRRRFERLFARLRAQALDVGASRALIARVGR